MVALKHSEHVISIGAVVLFGMIWIGSHLPNWFDKIDACEFDKDTKRCTRCLSVGDERYVCDRLESDNGHFHLYEVCTMTNDFEFPISVCSRGETRTVYPNGEYKVLRCEICGHIHTDDDVIVLK